MIVLHFGTLSDRSTFTSTNVRTTDLRHGFFGGTCCRQGSVVTSCVCVFVAVGDVLTQQQQQHQTEASVAAANATAAARVCLQELKLSPSPNLFMVSKPGTC